MKYKIKDFDITVKKEILKNKDIFVAHCLDLNITSQGYSYEEAFKNVKDAIQLYLEENPQKMPNKKYT